MQSKTQSFLASLNCVYDGSLCGQIQSYLFFFATLKEQSTIHSSRHPFFYQAAANVGEAVTPA
jgi:hypothetical protein